MTKMLPPVLHRMQSAMRNAVMDYVSAERMGREAAESVKRAFAGHGVNWLKNDTMHVGQVLRWGGSQNDPSRLRAYVKNARTGKSYWIYACWLIPRGQTGSNPHRTLGQLVREIINGRVQP